MGKPESCSILVGLDLTSKCDTRLERLARDGQSSLLGFFVSDEETKFHNI
jgi:hypothetical protein